MEQAEIEIVTRLEFMGGQGTKVLFCPPDEGQLLRCTFEQVTFLVSMPDSDFGAGPRGAFLWDDQSLLVVFEGRAGRWHGGECEMCPLDPVLVLAARGDGVALADYTEIAGYSSMASWVSGRVAYDEIHDLKIDPEHGLVTAMGFNAPTGGMTRIVIDQAIGAVIQSAYE